MTVRDSYRFGFGSAPTCALAMAIGLASLFGNACHSKSTPESARTAETAAPAVQSAGPAEKPSEPGQLYGTALSAQPSTALTALLSEPDKYEGKTVTVEGQVRRNCTRRGCWLELASSMDPSQPGCRVTFKDYAFFVPTNSQGSEAKVQGVVQVETVKPSHVRHLEEEGATFAKKEPDGSARELQLVASGVRLWRDTPAHL